jgi:hypothetical protein
MKFPFTFSTKLILRLILPGLIISAAFAPTVHSLLHWGGFKIGLLELLPLEVVFWGWLVVLSDMPIYMLYEGRRFWPEPLWRFCLTLETARLQTLTANAAPQMRERNYRLYQESGIELLNFPIGKSGEPEVRYPTRLGNLITAYETYPSVSYRLDSVFYWARLWVVLDKDLREEMDNQQALADSALYISFCLWVSSVILLAYSWSSWAYGLHLIYVPATGVMLGLASVCGVGAFVLYRISLFAHGQFGELYKALFDQFRGKLLLDDVIEEVGRLTDDPMLGFRSKAEKYRIVSRFLRWHRIRPPSENRNFTPEEWRAEVERRSKGSPQS